MGKIYCSCGEMLSDNSEANKARIIADKDFEKMMEQIIAKPADAYWLAAPYFESFYQCYHCHNLIFVLPNATLEFKPVDPESSADLVAAYLRKTSD
ncbi:MAG: hypothetical protein JO301_16460 [Chitinophagaceae bacterium]|nr:hypothetical protein [Chitinophagaceae bacterium]